VLSCLQALSRETQVSPQERTSVERSVANLRQKLGWHFGDGVAARKTSWKHSRNRSQSPAQHRLRSIAQVPQWVAGIVLNRFHTSHEPLSLVKSKQRVADHGEVFTPAWMVEAMLDLVKDETERIDSRFLEPACGSGNFLVQILRRKLTAVELKYGKSDFARRHYALLGLMCIYGIELLSDNIADCRDNVLDVFAEYLNIDETDDLYRAACYVLSQNLLHGDALTMRNQDGHPITFSEWGYLGKGKYQCRDFRFDVLTGSSAFSAEGSLFADLGKHEIFAPTKTHPPMTVRELAAALGDSPMVIA
jgi:N-6 DNA Methylase